MSKKSQGVLGVSISDGSIEAVLLRSDATGVSMVKKFVKPRLRSGDRVGDLAAVIPGLKESTDADYTMEIGDGSGGSSAGLFLTSEFSHGGGAVAEQQGTESAVRRSAPFGLQLKEILTACEKLGYPEPEMAFCIGSSEVSYMELSLPAAKNKKGLTEASSAFAASTSDTKTLLAKLKESKGIEADRNRVGFVALSSDEKRRRFLAVVPATPDPGMGALKTVSTRSSRKRTFAAVVDAEVSLLHWMARRDVLNRKGNVAIVRVGAEDTLILFLNDGMLDRHERLRSLTSYDPVDTICSRVLLKQDEWKIGNLDRVYISSDYHSASGMAEYESFFSDSETMSIVELLGSAHIKLPVEENGSVRSSTLPAIAVALRVLQDSDKDAHGSINLVSKKQRKELSTSKARFAWHSLALLAVLFGMALFYTWQFMQGAEEIGIKQEEVRLNPPQFPTESATLLRARVDSLNLAYQKYTRGLFVLDSLLTGSDKWSTSLAELSSSTNDIARIWIKGWSPEGGEIRLEGNALKRDRVAALAERWNGSIEKLNFADIQGVRVYTFIMRLPLSSEMPKVALYLREQSINEMEPDATPQLVTLREIASE